MGESAATTTERFLRDEGPRLPGPSAGHASQGMHKSGEQPSVVEGMPSSCDERRAGRRGAHAPVDVAALLWSKLRATNPPRIVNHASDLHLYCNFRSILRMPPH